ncbi:keratin-associated protein 10-11-like [Pseudoliparis swirei]|uniref:keratin-associated protein 10-11-like n=1 Tax=Pseudoliparis swirei TaxID=2059687 RepID=UPI0024BD5EC5|nr:keratin-associated protein 10-11-like [Pseudoliparis swirei]
MPTHSQRHKHRAQLCPAVPAPSCCAAARLCQAPGCAQASSRPAAVLCLCLVLPSSASVPVLYCAQLCCLPVSVPRPAQASSSAVTQASVPAPGCAQLCPARLQASLFWCPIQCCVLRRALFCASQSQLCPGQAQACAQFLCPAQARPSQAPVPVSMSGLFSGPVLLVPVPSQPSCGLVSQSLVSWLQASRVSAQAKAQAPAVSVLCQAPGCAQSWCPGSSCAPSVLCLCLCCLCLVLCVQCPASK